MNDLISRQAVLDAFEGELYSLSLFEKIQNLPSAQPETHEERTETHACDCISRQAAIDSICRTVCDNPEICESPCDEIKVLETMPSAQPDLSGYSDRLWKAAYERGKVEAQRKKGKWIYGESEAGNDGYYCSKCGNFVPWKYDEYDIDFIKEFLFCNKCGADMREGGESDEPKRCDTCKHEKERWFSRCADCSDFELWESKE